MLAVKSVNNGSSPGPPSRGSAPATPADTIRRMSNAIFPIAAPVNEPVRSYAPGSAEKKSLKQRLDAMLAEEIEIPERLPYEDRELVLNKANVDAAVSAQGFASSTDLKKPLWFTGR